MRRTEGRRLGYVPLFLRGQEILYVLDTWGSVIIELNDRLPADAGRFAPSAVEGSG